MLHFVFNFKYIKLKCNIFKINKKKRHYEAKGIPVASFLVELFFLYPEKIARLKMLLFRLNKLLKTEN
jgi:hypothetical protein